MRILVVEADLQTREQLQASVGDDATSILVFAGIAEAESARVASTIDAIIIDLDSAGSEGLGWCRRLRADGWSQPILVVAGNGRDTACADALDAGADDFIRKPFMAAELGARLRAVARRGGFAERRTLRRGNAYLDFAKRRALHGDEPVSLTPAEWEILMVLDAHASEVVSREELIAAIGGTAAVGQRSLEVLVGRIRKKLGANLIRTVRGKGYATGD